MRISDWSSDVCSSDLQMLVSPCRLRAPGVNDDDPAAALYDRVQSFLEPGLADQRPLGDQRISADQDGERGPPQIRPRQERAIIVEEMAGHKAGRGVFRIDRKSVV